jgi:hypothetical protein
LNSHGSNLVAIAASLLIGKFPLILTSFRQRHASEVCR